MAVLYLSFLGKGSWQAHIKDYDYNPATYVFNGKKSQPTKYVQAAEIELLKPKTFDRGLVVVTEESRKRHFDALRAEMAAQGLRDVQPIEIKDDFTPQSQWEWFQKIVQHIGQGDLLTVDVTHGYRAFSIVFTNAINFVQRVRQVVLEGVYYGAYERDPNAPPIVDLKDFFIIHEWADGVNRLVEDADARKLVDLAQKSHKVSFEVLRDNELSKVAKKLTEKIRNVDVHRMKAAAYDLVQAVKKIQDKALPVEQDLLDLLLSKFDDLAAPLDKKEKYDRSYFDGQIKIIRLLLEHQLYMQALTAMRELIGSFGLIKVSEATVHTSRGRSQRHKAEVFIRMLLFEEKKHCFTGDDERIRDKLMPYYQELKNIGAVDRIKAFLHQLLNYRNGMDHAWTKKGDTPEDVAEKSFRFLKDLEDVVELLKNQGLLAN
ncbi:TIGR02221 family CRISPR-associated protein [Desulfosoma caldarium]|uniref:CRISPR-associated Csx2 family protein n=1 Tax=Desulfosoma caldarium TaxID=610254 RepID=A0A3N1UXS2_9BACT|nr:TIGR02221 family CRISPR-associated protein [Desulfosoma caldarium]ROQ92066.1 CRISPR-associated Csx2 family protein [Desulfosoma caldarium]